MTHKTYGDYVMDNGEKNRIKELEYKINWLEKRYSQAMICISDAVANTLPLELQQKLFLDIAKRLAIIKNADLTRKN